MFHVKHYDVIVVGGGHAGCEAAHAAARTGSMVALVSLTAESLGVLSCNPAIGGLGKGHLVREIDALDGIMGRAADASGIQFRLLNRKKGPAVRGPRAQVDRKEYREFIQAITSTQENIDVVVGEVADLSVEGGSIGGVTLATGERILASNVVLTAGTFLRGLIHVGHEKTAGGRMGDKPSNRLAERLDDFDLPLGRLKTGTPPRLDGRTISWETIEMQAGDVVPSLFSECSTEPAIGQISCGITHTNAHTHDIIRKNLESSAMYGGQIDGVGPRYCPSIEDKIVRFAEKDSHQIFLEPEGLNDPTVYPNGISTSLPLSVQKEYVRSIVGLEESIILQPGYAIEYDYFDPRSLNPSLESRACAGLFLAGQINGTTGYEEAAAQGLVAGLNAARRSRCEKSVIFSRSTSYIGVMIDDLVTRGVTEPYRMFTSRAEFRLSLRADNADQRLTDLGRQCGLVTDGRWAAFGRKMDEMDHARNLLEAQKFTARSIAEIGVTLNPDTASRNGIEALSLSDFDVGHLVMLSPGLKELNQPILEQLKCDALYSKYIERQERDVLALQREEGTVLPADFDYDAVGGLSFELTKKLKEALPATLAHARKIDGMTPAGLMVIRAKLQSIAEKRRAI